MKPKNLELTYQQYLENGRSIQYTYLDKYLIFKKIDQGAIGQVYLGIDTQFNKKIAIKFVDIKKITKKSSSQQEILYMRKMIKNQAKLMKKLNSQHILKCYQFYHNQSFTLLVIQYCNGKNLNQYLHEHKKLTQTQIMYIFKQILIGISVMHSKKIIHRDIKTQNIMFHNGVLKILDLGLSKYVQTTQAALHSLVGTPTNMAPQVLNRQKYGLKADIWSLGIVLYQMVYGVKPYRPQPTFKLINTINNKDIFYNDGNINGRKPSKPLLKLLKSMLMINQNERISWDELISSQILCQQYMHLPSEYRLMVSTINIDRNEDIEGNQFQEIMEQTQQSQSICEDRSSQISYNLSSINKERCENLFSEASQAQQQLFLIVKQYFLDCKKAEFILYHIFQPIENHPDILNLNKRKNVQFMYLLISRCYCYLSFVNQDIKHVQNYLVDKLKQALTTLFLKVANKFQQYSLKLSSLENKFTAIITDRYYKISNKEYINEKDKYLVGVEINSSPTLKKYSNSLPSHKFQSPQKIMRPQSTKTIVIQQKVEQKINGNLAGFSRKQQISYTYENYIKNIIPLFKQQKHCSLVKALKNYLRINNLNLSETKQIGFDQIIEIILKY